MRIFVATTLYNMEKSLFLDTLESMGHEVIHHGWEFEDTYKDEWWVQDKADMNNRMLAKILMEHKKEPIDLFFSYMSSRTTYGSTIKVIKELTDIPCVNFCWDDRTKIEWQFEIARYYDLCWTTDKFINYTGKDIDAVEAYRRIGAKAISLPAGANPDLFVTPECWEGEKYQISFIGSGGGAYGYRDEIIKKLKAEFGDDLHLFGSIANNKVSTEEYVDIIHQTKINLGFAGSAGADKICSQYMAVKGRDFEVPMAGGFYLTEYNPDLCELYDADKEIVTYSSYKNLITAIRFYLENDQARIRIARDGCKRARTEHTMQRRFEAIFRELCLVNN